MRRPAWLGLPLAALLAACSPAGLLNAVTPGTPVAEGVAYAEGPRFRADVYAPGARCAGAPVVLFFYGGGWEAGERGMYRFLGGALAARGVVTIIPDYRIWPEAGFPAFMTDAAAALAWARAHAAEYGGDPDRLFLMGHSAGAQIATLLALDTRYQRQAGIGPGAVAGVIGISGPYDFLPLTSPTLKAIFGPEERWPESQPINFVTPQAPPMLLATGTGDETVDPGNTTRLAARLRQAGVPVEERRYEGVGHSTTAGAFAGILSFLAPVRRDALDFIAARSGTTCLGERD
jgi:acetyl esterase/lipase